MAPNNRPGERVRVRNASDPVQVKDAAFHERFSRETLHNSVRAVLATREGRDVLWWWLSKCEVYDSITETSSMIYVRSGRRDVGVELIQLIAEAAPKAYLLMQQEAAKLVEDTPEPPITSEDPTS